MNLRDAQRFLSNRRMYLAVERVDGHDWVTDLHTAVRRDQLPASFTIEPAGRTAERAGGLRKSIHAARAAVLPGRVLVERHATTTDGTKVAIVTRGSLMLAVNARVLSGMPGEKRITSTGIALGFLPDKKGTPRLVALAMPVRPATLWPLVSEAVTS